MTTIRTTFHYSVRELRVDSRCLGSSFNLDIQDHTVRITLPLKSFDEYEAQAEATTAPIFDGRFPPRQSLPPVHKRGDIYVTGSVRRAGSSPGLPVDVLRAEVILTNASFCAHDFRDRLASPDVWERAEEEIRQAGDAADVAVQRLVEWSRVTLGQSWLGIYGEQVQRVCSDEVVDLDAGRRLPWPARLDVPLPIRCDPWTVERIQHLRQLIEAGRVPDMSDSLLADAELLLTAGNPPDPSRALLIAAITCEIRVKAVLRDLSSADQAPLVDLLLSSPRDYSLAATALFDKPMRIVSGTSLKESDNALWKRVVRLFEHRNALAHRGVHPTAEQARDAVAAVAAAFDWLAQICLTLPTHQAG